jgi:hypothetical protein
MSFPEILGYVASVVIAASMTMNSIVKFRWINFIGASSFAVYGLLIDALPVTILNGFILLVDLYYLFRIYTKKELFTTLEVAGGNKYLINFLDFHNKEIQKFFPGFKYKRELNTLSFFVLRNMAVAGIFLAHKQSSKVLKVGLDYVIPEYRDYKNGKFIYHRLRQKFLSDGIEKIVVVPQTYNHVKYLKKIGFNQNEEGLYEISLLDKK